MNEKNVFLILMKSEVTMHNYNSTISIIITRHYVNHNHNSTLYQL